MFFRRKESKKDPKKAGKLQEKGDRQVERHALKKAMKSYRSALQADPDNPALYQKLIDTKEKLKEEWSEEDFSETMAWTMKKQELENPGIKEIHEVLSPEYNEIRQAIVKMLTTPPELREPLIAKVKGYGTKALRPLLDTLLSMDALARSSPENTTAEEAEPKGSRH